VPRFLRLVLSLSLFTAFITVVLSPQIGHAVIPPPGDPAYSQDCPSNGPSVCPPQHLPAYSFSISLTEGNVANETSVAQVRSSFGATLGFSPIYNSYAADGSRTMFMGPGSQTDIGLGYGWTHMYNDLLFSWHGDVFRVGPDGRITRFALQNNGSYLTSPGYFETLVKNNDGSFDLTTKYQTDYHYESIPDTPFLVDGPVLRPTSITDRNNNVTTLTYTDGNLALITDTYGRSIQLNYNGNHHLTTVIDPFGVTTTFSYNANGNLLTAITDPTGKTTSYTYNNLNQITSKTDRDGRVFTILYNHNLPSSELDGNGGTIYTLTNPTNWASDPVQLLKDFMRVYIPSTTSATDGRGNVWTYSYDSNAHPLRVTAPDGAVTTYTYDPATLKVHSVTDADGNTTTYSYDAEGNTLTRSDALGHVTTYTYDSQFNQMLSMTDPQGRITTYTIDGHGNRLSETDPLGGIRKWAYDSHGNVLTDTDKDGNTTTFAYDGYGNRNTVTDALNDVAKYTHDIMGNVTSMTDADGNTTRYQYDALYRLILVTDALGGQKQYFYDGEGDKIKFIDENGHATLYSYDQRMRLTTVTDALGGVITYTYDGNNNKLSMTDQNGHTTTYAYDVQNRLIQVTDALGDTTHYAYDPVGNLISETDANGHTTTYRYDALNRRVQKTDALSEVTTWVYDLTGLPGCPVPPGPCSGPTLGSQLVTEQIDGSGKVIYYAYDGLDRLIVEDHKQGNTRYEIDPNDAVTVYIYDPNSNRLTWQQPDGNRTNYTYDAVNRMIQMVQVQTGDTTRWTYDPFGNVKTVTAPNLNATTYSYDALNRKIQQTDSDGPVGTWSYDPVSNLVSSTDGDGNLTSYAYDGLNRRVTMTDALGDVTQYFYDPVGNQVKVIDREGNPATYSYDAINRLLTITTALPATTTFQYDPVGNRTAIIDANGHTTTFAYDKVNRKISETYPDLSNNTITWTYDQVGNVITRTDQESQITTYSYSDLYFLLSRAYSPSGSADIFTYDLSGRVLSGLRSSCLPACLNWNETFAYDGADRLLQSVQNGQTVSYVYNIPGRTRTVTYPSGRNITEQWDFRPQILTVNDGGPTPIAQYSYDFASNVLTRGYRNGTLATYTYNPDNWVCSLTNSLGANLVVGFTYGYDNEGNKFYEQKLHETDDSEAYIYDPVYRLINYQAGTLNGSPPPNCPTSPLSIQMPPTIQTAYTLDKLGNWTSKYTFDHDGSLQNRTFSPSNEITSINTSQVASDYNGNTTSYVGIGYSYDEENRLYQATPQEGNFLGQYFYDAFGRRVSKIDNLRIQTFYYYDGWRTIEERWSAGLAPATYVFGNYLDEALTMDRGGATYYYHQNALWSTFALTDSNGKGVEGYQYDPYGYQTLVLPGQDGILDFGDDDVFLPGAKSSVGNPFLFTEQRFDPETGFLYYKNRYNSTFFGRFMSRDPIDYAAGDMNLYAYVGDRPTNLTDPTGNASNYYLRIDGVTEESTAPNFQKQIELDSWSFGASSPADIGGGLAAGKSGEEIWVDKYGRVKVQFYWGGQGQNETLSLADFDLDSSSYQILKALYQGTHIDKTALRVEDNSREYVKNDRRLIVRNQDALVEADKHGHVKGDHKAAIYDKPMGDQQEDYVEIHQKIALPYDLPDRQTVSTFKSRSSKGGGSAVYMNLGTIAPEMNFGTIAPEFKEQKPDGTLGGSRIWDFPSPGSGGPPMPEGYEAVRDATGVAGPKDPDTADDGSKLGKLNQ
jgi:RHS repeat-associated protein